MGEPAPGITRGQWMALMAALLGWMFDGLEMGLFPLVARPALMDLLPGEAEHVIGKWISVATAGFLVGAATGGVLFGWLGDRIGRVRAMTLSVLTYAVFSGACGFATSPLQIAGLRFLSALGMGGEWSLGVALVMEIWPNRSRAFLAGLIGAAANVGYLLIAIPGLFVPTADGGWRILMFIGAVPAALTFFIRLFVPESQRWQQEQERGTLSNWQSRDLLGVGVGLLGAGLIVYLWAADLDEVLEALGAWAVDGELVLRIAGTLLGLVIVLAGYLYPVYRFAQRSAAGGETDFAGATLRTMLLGACLSGVALLGTWAAIQMAPVWADKLTGGLLPQAKAYTQIWSATGAIIGTILAALLGDWLGRRLTYLLLCIGSLASALAFFQLNSEYGPVFLFSIFIAGGLTASFYGWLPLYLPELFRTKVRATGQGFSFNFGRVLAAIGVLQIGHLMKNYFNEDYATVCSVMSLVYVVGMLLIWLAPETKGKPLPE